MFLFRIILIYKLVVIHDKYYLLSPQLQAQLERIAKVNADLRRKANTHKKQSRALLEEKVDLESQLHSKDAEVEHIKKLIKEQEQYEEQREAVKAAIEASRSIEDDQEEEVEVCLLRNSEFLLLSLQFLVK